MYFMFADIRVKEPSLESLCRFHDKYLFLFLIFHSSSILFCSPFYSNTYAPEESFWYKDNNAWEMIVWPLNDFVLTNLWTNATPALSLFPPLSPHACRYMNKHVYPYISTWYICICMYFALLVIQLCVCLCSWISRGRKCYEPPKYMTIHTAISQLLEVEEMRRESGMLLTCLHNCTIVTLWSAYYFLVLANLTFEQKSL